jgi:group I intron endonuclease
VLTFNLSDYLNLPTETGVYCIYSLVSTKIYVGSASDTKHKYGGFRQRLKHHVNALNRGNHDNRHLQRSFNKNGIENFRVVLLEFCEPKFCLDREQFYIDTLKPEYNIWKIVVSSLGVKRTEETKLKLSLANKGQGAKPFKFLNEKGKIIEGSNLKDFCKVNGLNQGHMGQVNLGQKRRYKNFFALDDLYLPFIHNLQEELKNRKLTEYVPSHCFLAIRNGTVGYTVEKQTKIKGRAINLFWKFTKNREEALELALLISQVWG